jgi:hypothetical protein
MLGFKQYNNNLVDEGYRAPPDRAELLSDIASSMKKFKVLWKQSVKGLKAHVDADDSKQAKKISSTIGVYVETIDGAIQKGDTHSIRKHLSTISEGIRNLAGMLLDKNSLLLKEPTAKEENIFKKLIKWIQTDKVDFEDRLLRVDNLKG